jgi:hypothetical protein
MEMNISRKYHAQVCIDGILRSMYAEGLNYESGAAEVYRQALTLGVPRSPFTTSAALFSESLS